MLEPQSYVDVDLGAIGRNAAAFSTRLGEVDSKLCGVIKADAYGLGAVRVGKRLESAGAAMLAVYGIQEAKPLVDSAIGLPILVLLPVAGMDRSDAMFRALSLGKLELSIHDADSLRVAREISETLGINLRVHVAVDTGMGRGGSMPIEAAQIVREISQLRRVELAGVGTHFARVDRDAVATAEQADVFDKWLQSVHGHMPESTVIHTANTYGTVRSSRYAYSMVRVGIGLYGCGMDRLHKDDKFEWQSLLDTLEPAVQWVSKVRQVRHVPGGWSVGYGSTWTAPTGGATLAGIPVGYADGYPLGLSSDPTTGMPRAKVGVDVGEGVIAYAPVVGRVSMDQIVIDVTGMQSVKPGSPVEVIGRFKEGPTSVDELARRGSTLSHHVLCSISHRVPRRYSVSEHQPEVTTRPTRIQDANPSLTG